MSARTAACSVVLLALGGCLPGFEYPSQRMVTDRSTSTVEEASVYEPVAVSPPLGVHATFFYATGQPFAYVETDSATVLLNLSSVDIVGRAHLRLWLLYRSKSSQATLLEPRHMATLLSRAIVAGDSAQTYPVPATEVLAAISAAENNALISQAIGGALAGFGARMATQPTRITGSGVAMSSGNPTTTNMTATVNDASEKGDARAREVQATTESAMAVTRASYEMFKMSVSDGLFRKHTVFPGDGVNGYIYLPAPTDQFRKVGEFAYSVRLQLPYSSIVVQFKRMAEE